ncbi:RmlC-like cupin domain-containing protein [Chaetomium fimeti]|uniref:RmlC-like cupin domain-containing protein n=1 Tax=Chaetomium fimeti TaxID=1854472 RepID=A0AAE0HC53_9PEZI|nr:RmlC-like cupin domain-containing protein [Chaetomium fimeti]
MPFPGRYLSKMASLIPLIEDILPMILPASVAVTKAADILPPDTQAGGDGDRPEVRIIRRNAVIDKTDKMCTSILIVKPNSSSTVHHHGEQETIIYTVSGQGSLLSQPKGDDEEPERHELGPGDFAFIPAWTEHQAVNNSETDFHLVIIRTGGRPVEVDLTGWGGPQVEDVAKR